MSITSSILSATSKSIEKLFNDPALTASITYKQFVGSSFDQDSGYNIDVYIDFALTSIKTEKKRFIMGSPGEMGGISGTEVNFLIKSEGMPSEPSNRDLIVHGSDTHAIEQINEIAGLLYRCEVKGL